MSYYAGTRGDYYRGSRGDPFSVGGILKGIGKVGGGILGGLVTGGPIGAIAGGLGGLLGSTLPGGSTPSIIPGLPPRPTIPGTNIMGAGLIDFGLQGPGKPKPGLGGVISRILPGGDTGYFKRKRMNVTNPRALRRAIRRVSGFGKLVQRSKRAIARANTAVGNKHRTVRRGRFK